MLARTARARSPLSSTTAARVRRSVATARKGIGRESKLPRAKRLPRSRARLRAAFTPVSRAIDCATRKPPVPCSHTTSGRRSPRARGVRWSALVNSSASPSESASDAIWAAL